MAKKKSTQGGGGMAINATRSVRKWGLPKRGIMQSWQRDGWMIFLENTLHTGDVTAFTTRSNKESVWKMMFLLGRVMFPGSMLIFGSVLS